MSKTPGLKIKDVRAKMPNYDAYKDSRRVGDILGIAIHHSATANPLTGLCMDDALSIFRFHVHKRGWEHGGYNYLIHPNGLVEYALDDAIAAFHAGFKDPQDELELEFGQYWNNHYLAVCLLGWFEKDRIVKAADGQSHQLPNHFTRPTSRQIKSLVAVHEMLAVKYQTPVENVRGHRELIGCKTRCPGGNINLSALREALACQDASLYSP